MTIAENLDFTTCRPVVSFDPSGNICITGDVTARPSKMLDALADWIEALGPEWEGFDAARNAYDELCGYAAAEIECRPAVRLPYERTAEVLADGSIKVGVRPAVDAPALVDEICKACKAVAKDPSNLSDQGMKLGFAGNYVEEDGKLFVFWADSARRAGDDAAKSPRREFRDRREWEASRAAAALRELLAGM